MPLTISIHRARSWSEGPDEITITISCKERAAISFNCHLKHTTRSSPATLKVKQSHQARSITTMSFVDKESPKYNLEMLPSDHWSEGISMHMKWQSHQTIKIILCKESFTRSRGKEVAFLRNVPIKNWMESLPFGLTFVTGQPWIRLIKPWEISKCQYMVRVNHSTGAIGTTTPLCWTIHLSLEYVCLC